MEETFSKLGIQLSYVKEFINHCGGKNILRGKTTEDIRNEFILPMTDLIRSSYCDYLIKLGRIKVVGDATVFISHAWQSKFMDVIEALLNHFESTPDIFIWFDIFSYNQHDTTRKDFQWWSVVFQEAVEEFGHTVMVLTPWSNPLPLTRAWCLWELYCTVNQCCYFEIALSEVEEQRFLKDISKNPEGVLNRVLTTIDLKNSEARNPADKEAIFEVVEKTIGLKELNNVVFESIREWIIVVAKRKLVEQHQLPTLAALYFHQGQYEKALTLFERTLQHREQFLGEDHPYTLASMSNLAGIYDKLGKHDEALQLCVETLERRRKILGEDHPDTLTTMNNLATFHCRMDKFEQALPIYYECFERMKRVVVQNDQEDHGDAIAILMNNFLTVCNYRRGGNNEKVFLLYERFFEYIKRVFGENHPNTLTAMNNLAEFYRNQEKFDEALPLYMECLEHHNRIFGEEHPSSLLLMSNISDLRYKLGKDSNTRRRSVTI